MLNRVNTIAYLKTNTYICKMKEKTIKFTSIEFDEIEGDTGTVHHEYRYEKCPHGDILKWTKDDVLQTIYSGVEMREKINNLMR